MVNHRLNYSLINKLKNLSMAIATIAAGIGNYPSLAQIAPDTSLGAESSVVTPNVEVKGETADRIDGGAVRQGNLFHSFSEFNVDAAQRVYFTNPNNIEQIFTRVTGNNASNIDGTLGVDGAADLLLLNPNGIIFGENSSLDVEGSFFGTSADSVLFEDETEFSAVQPNSSLLTVSVPVGLQMGNPGSIEVRSPLTIADGQDFTLLGGEINLTGNNINIDEFGLNSAADGIIAPGGRVELGGLSTAGIVSFNDDNNLVLPKVSRADINLNNYFINASTGGGGSIALKARNFKLKDSFIVTGINSNIESTEAQAGNITIDADEATILEASDNSGNLILNATGENITGDLSEFELSTDNSEAINISGNAGNISIDTNSLSATGRSFIYSLTNGEGDAGSIDINAKDSISFDLLMPLDLSGQSANIASIASIVGGLGTGNGADVTVRTKSFSLNDTIISTVTNGAGNAGNIALDVEDTVTLDGSIITAETLSNGNGANIKIDTRSLSANNTVISTTTLGAGNAGNITIDATNSVVASNNSSIEAATLGSGDAGNIIFESGTANLTFENQTFVGTPVAFRLEGELFDLPGSSFIGTGKGGDTIIKGQNLFVTNNSAITTLTGGEVTADGLANAGNIELNISDSIKIIGNSAVSSETLGEGNAGNLTVNTDKLAIENSAIFTTSTGSGTAGSIDISASQSIDLTGSTFVNEDKVPAGLFTLSTKSSASGDVTINTRQLRIADGAQIEASTLGVGNGGSITIEADGIQLVGSSEDDFPSAISARSNGSGNGGIVDITTNNLTITDDAGISVSSFGNGNAGSIFALINDSLKLNNGAISSRSDRSSGGEVEISAGDIRLKGDSNIQTDVENGAGGGGNITLTADSIVAFDDSDIFSFSADGRGGNITLNTDTFFGANYTSATLDANPQLLDNNSRVDINATGSVSGFVELPEIKFIPNSLAELSEDRIDAEEVVANSCVVRSESAGGTFIVTGSEGLPSRPGDAAVVDYATGNVRSTSDKTKPTANNWQPGEPIVEPDKAYRLANGKLVLSRQCDK